MTQNIQVLFVGCLRCHGVVALLSKALVASLRGAGIPPFAHPINFTLLCFSLILSYPLPSFPVLFHTPSTSPIRAPTARCKLAALALACRPASKHLPSLVGQPVSNDGRSISNSAPNARPSSHIIDSPSRPTMYAMGGSLMNGYVTGAALIAPHQNATSVV